MLVLDLMLQGQWKITWNWKIWGSIHYYMCWRSQAFLAGATGEPWGKEKTLPEDNFGNLIKIVGGFNWVLVIEVPAGSPEVAVPSKKLGALHLVRPEFEFSSNLLTQFPHLQMGIVIFTSQSCWGRWWLKIVLVQHLVSISQWVRAAIFLK